MGKWSKVEKAYRFFLRKEAASESFTANELRAATGWSESTINAYRTKKWSGFLVGQPEGRLRTTGLTNLSLDYFMQLHSQKAEVARGTRRPSLSECAQGLLDKAREAALLGVAIYNNPTVSFRGHGYLVQMVIAWRALLAAVFERDGIDYVYRDKLGNPKTIDGEQKAWDLDKCAAAYFQGKAAPVEKNLEFCLRLRNRIEHRYLPALDGTVSGECQALLLNFERVLTEEFGHDLGLGAYLAVSLQCSTIANEQRAQALRVLQTSEYEAVQKFISDFRQSLKPGVYESSEFSFRAFLLPKIGNHARSADVAIEFVRYDPDRPEEMAIYERTTAMIKERKVRVVNLGLLKPGEVVKRVREETGVHFTTTDHTKAWRKFRVRPRGSRGGGENDRYCCFDAAHKDYLYTEEWVGKLSSLASDPEGLKELRAYRL